MIDPMTNPVPTNESRRLRAVLACGLLDTQNSNEFDDLARLAALICNTPMASISLIDDSRAWFKAAVGFDLPEIPRALAFCAHTICQTEPLVVPDTSQDDRFAGSPYVLSDPYIRSYAGVRLCTAAGEVVGAVGVADTIPRRLSAEQIGALEMLATQASSQIQLSRNLAVRERTEAALRASESRFRECMDAMREGVVVLDESGSVTIWNKSAESILGLSAAEIQRLTPETICEQCVREDGAPFGDGGHPAMMALSDGFARNDMVVGMRRRDGELLWLLVNAAPVGGPCPDHPASCVLVSFTDITLKKMMMDERSRLAAIVNSTQESIVATNLDGTIVCFNHGAELLHEMSATEVIGRHYLDVFADGLITPEMDRRVLAGERIDNVQGERARRNGSRVSLSLDLCAIRNPSGEIIGRAAIGHDVTERRRSREALERSEARYAQAQAIGHFGNWELNLETGELSCSDEMCRIYGFDPRTTRPSEDDLMSRYNETDRAMARRMHQQAIERGETVEYDIQARLPDGRVTWRHCLTRPVHEGGSEVKRIMGTVLDITDTKRTQDRLRDYTAAVEFQKQALEAANRELDIANRRLRSLATEDGLTGLKNHRSFQEQLAHEIGRSRRTRSSLSMAMLDVDLFKSYNDTYGHPEGDAVLRLVASTISAAVRSYDVVARYGGEEFAIILPSTDARTAETVAERVRLAIERADWPKRKITVSIGVATASDAALDGPSLIEAADEALYASKNSGRNRVTAFSPAFARAA